MRVAEARIVKALRVMSVDRGRDPRRYRLLAFGGAGPLHQGRLARELGCEAVIVPRHPGVLSAMGLLVAVGAMLVGFLMPLLSRLVRRARRAAPARVPTAKADDAGHPGPA